LLARQREGSLTSDQRKPTRHLDEQLPAWYGAQSASAHGRN
jgi:hypothetical protein